MTIGVVQKIEAEFAQFSPTHSTQAATLPGTPTPGNTLTLVCISISTGVPATVPAGWTSRYVYGGDFAFGCAILVATKVAGIGESPSVTVTFPPSRRSILHVWETNGGWGGIAGTDSGGTVHDLASVTPTAGVEALVVAVVNNSNAYGITGQPSGWGSPFAETVSNDGASDRLAMWSRHENPTAGAYGGTVTYGGSCGSRAATMWFSGLSAPVADFTGTPLSGEAPLSVTFTDASTNTPTSWAWAFGDGSTSTSQDPSHSYNAPGVYAVALTATNASGISTKTKTAYVVVTGPGIVVEWDDSFVDVGGDIREWTIQRGASPELTGGMSSGQATILVVNRNDKYNPENVAGPYYGLLHDGPRIWIGVNEDGTVAPDPGKDVYGLFAGRITDLSLIPGDGTAVAPFVEFVCEDPLAWMSRQKVTIAESRLRSQADLRLEVLDALGELNPNLPAEPTTMPLSGADGLALNVLEAINGANGTRHFAKPEDNSTDWYRYTAVRRTSGLDGTFAAAVDAGSEHVTGSSGWRTSADGVINQQKATVEDIEFPTRVVVWTLDTLPLTVLAATPVTIWADFGDYVDDPAVEANSDGSAMTATLTPFGRTAKLDLVSAGTTTITALDVRGRLVQRGSVQSVVRDDLASQADPRGVRAGPDLSGDYLGILVSAYGFAEHIVWRFGNPLYRPTVTVENWMPEMFDLDLFDRISFTSSQLKVTDRIFEIVGLTLHCDLAAVDADGNPVVHHTATYVLQESRVQTPTDWFTWDVTEWDDASQPWAY